MFDHCSFSKVYLTFPFYLHPYIYLLALAPADLLLRMVVSACYPADFGRCYRCGLHSAFRLSKSIL
jgi:hypothetical protein